MLVLPPGPIGGPAVEVLEVGDVVDEVRDVPATEHVHPTGAVLELGDRSALGRVLQGVRGDAMDVGEVRGPLQARCRLGLVDQHGDEVVVEDLAAVVEDPVLGVPDLVEEPVLLVDAFAGRQRLRRFEHRVQGPLARVPLLTGIGQSGILERRPVVVDPVRLGVLGQREDLAVIRERVARRGQEVLPVQARIVGDQVIERQERTAGRELGREVVTRAQRVGWDPAGDLPERCLGRLVVRLADVLVALDRRRSDRGRGTRRCGRSRPATRRPRPCC